MKFLETCAEYILKQKRNVRFSWYCIFRSSLDVATKIKLKYLSNVGHTKIGNYLIFICVSWRVIEPNVHIAFSIIIRKLINKTWHFYVKWQPEMSDDEKHLKIPKSAYWTSEIAVQNLLFLKLSEITSLWIKQITIHQLPNLLNLTSFWDRFFI